MTAKWNREEQLAEIAKLDAYRVRTESRLKELKADGVELEHKKTGARHFSPARGRCEQGLYDRLSDAAAGLDRCRTHCRAHRAPAARRSTGPRIRSWSL